MKHCRKILLALVAVAILAGGCGRTVTRVDPNTQIDLSGRWNDSDSRMVANQLVDQFINSTRFREYAKQKGHRPSVVVGVIENKTSEHIDAESYLKKFEMEIFNSGFVDLVESKAFRERLREERAEQQEFASPQTAAKWGRELGADLMLFGTMTSEIDTYKKKKVANYITTLYLSDVETAQRVWYGQQEIKKYIEN